MQKYPSLLNSLLNATAKSTKIARSQNHPKYSISFTSLSTYSLCIINVLSIIHVYERFNTKTDDDSLECCICQQWNQNFYDLLQCFSIQILNVPEGNKSFKQSSSSWLISPHIPSSGMHTESRKIYIHISK